MVNFEEAVKSNLLSKNYARALEQTRAWLNSIPLKGDVVSHEAYSLAVEVYYYITFLLNRSERLETLTTNKGKAYFFIECLEGLHKIRQEKKIIIESSCWSTILLALHSDISYYLAKELAGQRSYNLHEVDVIQLGTSLIEIGNWSAAQDALEFLQNIHSKHALCHYLLAYVYFEQNKIQNFYISLREALFLDPAIMLNREFCIKDDSFVALWEQVCHQEFTDPSIKYYYFALLAEVYGLYKIRKDLTKTDIKSLEAEFYSLYQDNNTHGFKQDKVKFRLLHYLTWLIYEANRTNTIAILKNYKIIMSEIDKNIYELFCTNNI